MTVVTHRVDWRGASRAAGLAERAASSASSRSGSEALRAMKAEGNRQVRAKKRFKLAAISRVLSLRFPSSKEAKQLLWVLGVRGDVVPLAAFPYRRTKQGVVVQVNVGRRAVVRNAFEATMRSGHTGIFRRAGPARRPIRELFTTRVVDVFRDKDTVEAIFDRARAVYGRAFDRLLPLELQRELARSSQ